MLNLSKELVDLASTIGEVSKTRKSLEKAKAARDLMVANAETDLAKAKADRQRVEAEVAEKLEELEEDRKRTEPILAEMDRLMAIRPMTPEIRNKCMRLMKKL